MYRSIWLARWLLPLALLNFAATAAEPKARSGILSRAPFELPAFEHLPKAPFGALSAPAYDKVVQVARGRLERIAYLSGGNKVFALVLPPAGVDARAPVVVYCRGGVGPGAAIGLASPFHLYEMSRYAEAGFFVIAPQYRGNDGGDGRDEVGGAEVADILALGDLLAAFPQADTSRRFLVGSSRGSMNALQAVRAGFEAKGVVVNGLPADWDLAFARNERLRGVANDFWPDFKGDAAGAIARRSAARWAADIDVPVLLQHGGADAIIHPSVALDFAHKLSEAGKPYDLVIYANDDHPILNRADERLARTIDWMRAHAPATRPD